MRIWVNVIFIKLDGDDWGRDGNFGGGWVGSEEMGMFLDVLSLRCLFNILRKMVNM